MFKRLLGLALAAAVAGCGPKADEPALRYESRHNGAPPIRLAIHPLHNPQLLLQAYGPLAAYLNEHIQGRSIHVEASRSYSAFEDKIRRREPELLLPNPWQTLLALKHGYKVLAMAGDEDDFRGLFLARRETPIQTVADLRGIEVAYPAATAVAAAMLPQQYLHDAGLDVGRDVGSLYVGSQESAILSVWSGKVKVAATWPPPWRAFQKSEPEKAAELKVLWRTPSLPNNAVMARDDLPASLVDRIRETLIGMHADAQGQAVLAESQTSRFWPADDATYDKVRTFTQRFEREVRAIDAPASGVVR